MLGSRTILDGSIPNSDITAGCAKRIDDLLCRWCYRDNQQSISSVVDAKESNLNHGFCVRCAYINNKILVISSSVNFCCKLLELVGADFDIRLAVAALVSSIEIRVAPSNGVNMCLVKVVFASVAGKIDNDCFHSDFLNVE